MTGELISTWQDAERCVASWLRLMGNPDARPTLSQANGLDVVSQTAVAQVRWRVAAASLIELRQFYESVANPQVDLYYFSRAGYTDDAVAWATEVGLAAFVLGADRRIEPLNDPARIALASVPPGTMPDWTATENRSGYRPAPAVRPTPAHTPPTMTVFAEPVPDPYPRPTQPFYLPETPPPGLLPAPLPAFRTVPSPPGRALRGWGIGAMVVGFAPALLLMLVMVAPVGSPAPPAVYVILAFFLIIGSSGIGLYRAGARQRDSQQPPEPPQLR